MLKGWPADLNTPEKIRACFSDTIEAVHIALRGKSNLTADEVFKTHIYRPSDCYIGWSFATMAHVSKINKRRFRRHYNRFDIDVDQTLLHDIVPQKGGLCEPLGPSTSQSKT